MGIDYVGFPGLGIEIKYLPKIISVFGFEIAWYGIIIALGMMLGVMVVTRQAKAEHENVDQYFDMAMLSLVAGVIGARIYYVIFSWEYYKDNLVSILNLRGGGLGIYGGILGAIGAIFIYTRKKKLSFLHVCDTIILGVPLGQMMGRWGNFFNREAFGEYTNTLFRMELPLKAVYASNVTDKMLAHSRVVDGASYITVHPTFFYESILCLCIFILLQLFKRYKGEDGEVFLLYLVLYGVGRFVIEGLRTDQLLLPYISIPASRVVAVIMVILSMVCFWWRRKNQKEDIA